MRIAALDFDFACLPGIVDNTKINQEWTKRLNITPKCNRYYDIHYFFCTLVYKGFLPELMSEQSVPIEVKNFNKYCFFEEKKACGKYLYEMCLIPNTDTSCKYNYYFSIWGGSSLDKINQKQWDTISAQNLGFLYNYPSSDLVTQQKGGGFVYQYPKNGRYLLVKQVISCLSDTTTFEKVTIDCLAGIEDLHKPEPKLIGTYDMLGRPVNRVEDNIPYIFLYDNGQRKKIIKVK